MALKRPSTKTLRRLLMGGAAFLALIGIGLVTYPFATDLWAHRIQGGLRGELAAGADAYRDGRIEVGDALTRLEIPSLDVDVIVVEGTAPAALHAGAGHYPQTALPGDPGNMAIAGHRTSYGRPFNRIHELRAGDRIVLTTPIGRHVYSVTSKPWVVNPNDWSPIRDYPDKGAWLTLTSCHPEGSASYRIVVRAELMRSSDLFAASEEAS